MIHGSPQKLFEFEALNIGGVLINSAMNTIVDVKVVRRILFQGKLFEFEFNSQCNPTLGIL